MPTAPVTDTQAAILLGGWSAKPPGDRLFTGFGHGFVDLITLGLPDLWRLHESYLRATAQAWGVKPAYFIQPANEYGLRFVVADRGASDEGPYYFSEALHLAGPQRV